jgi:hypothetical protein
MLRRSLILAALVVIAVVIAAAVARATRRYEDYLGGLWVGDQAFLDQAQLKDMQLFLAPREGGSRRGYLIMTDAEGEFLTNQAFELREKSRLRRWASALGSLFRASHDAFRGVVAIEFDGGGDAAFPERLKLSLSVLDGTLTLYDDERVYAFLYKDLAASAPALEAYAIGGSGGEQS